MDKSWTDWVKENISRGCDRTELGTILLQNKFTLPQIRKMMGVHYPEGLEELAGPAESPARKGGDADALLLKSVSLLEIQRDLARLSPQGAHD